MTSSLVQTIGRESLSAVPRQRNVTPPTRTRPAGPVKRPGAAKPGTSANAQGGKQAAMSHPGNPVSPAQDKSSLPVAPPSGGAAPGGGVATGSLDWVPANDSVLPAPDYSRFSVAIAISVVFHSLLLLLTFTLPDLKSLQDIPSTLQVVLVNAKSNTKPRKADALAQANLDGGGNTEQDRRAKSNMPVLREMTAEDELFIASQRVKELEEQAKLMLAQIKATNAIVKSAIDPVEKPVEKAAPNLPKAPHDKLAIAKLEAQIAKEWEAYQKLPKRKFIGARTEQVVYAEYVDDWRQRIERVGTENFPQEARENSVFGAVLVTVAIRSDGTVEKVEIERSSGSRVLDRAAKRVVQLASPFKPFPDKIRKETDILHITRNWVFTRSDLVVADQ